MLDGEPTLVPAPDLDQVSGQWATQPGQPQGCRGTRAVGQVLDLYAQHAEGVGGGRLVVQVIPGIHLHASVGCVLDGDGVIRRALGGRLVQPERGAVLVGSATSGVGLRCPAASCYETGTRRCSCSTWYRH